MTATTAIRRAFLRSLTIAGRSSRPEFWWYLTFHLVAPVLALSLAVFFGSALLAWLGVAIFFVTAPGVVTAMIRRRRDVGRSGLGTGLVAVLVGVVAIGSAIAVIAETATQMSRHSLTGVMLTTAADAGQMPQTVIFGAPLLLATGIMDVTMGGVLLGALTIAVLSIIGLPVAIVLGCLAWMLSRPTQPGTNRFGPPTSEVTR